MEVEYKGVKIKVMPGRGNERGSFVLSWPGHEPEKVDSQWKQSEFILGEAKEFVDTWLADGYIVVSYS
jgi:hypothetical protein